MLRIVTDGAADIPTGWDKEYDIQTVPINIHFGEKTFIQFEEMGTDDFYKEVKSNKTFPKTSQPSPHQFVEFYKKHYQPGDKILSIHVTSKLSGTFASAVAATEELRDTFHITAFDSLSGSLGLAYMCREARLMERAGKSLDEIVHYLESIRSKVSIHFTLDTLEYAKRSGRVGALSVALASMLNVKPIAVLSDGVLNMSERVRTRKAAISRVIEMGKAVVGDAPVYVGVTHARDLESGQAMLEEARKQFNTKEIAVTDMSVSLAIQFGPGALALILYPTG